MPKPNNNAYDDELLEEVFPWQETSPEEYAARYFHAFGCFSTKRMVFENPELEAWVKRFEEVFSSPEEIEACRDRFLDGQERAAQDETLRRIDKHGF